MTGDLSYIERSALETTRLRAELEKLTEETLPALGLEYREDDGPQTYWRNRRALEAEAYARRLERDLKAASRATDAARNLALLVDEIRALEAELFKLYTDPTTACSIYNEAVEAVDRGENRNVPAECWRDGEWTRRERPEGYCSGCLARTPIARRIAALKRKKGGTVRAIIAAGRLSLKESP